MYLVHRLRYKRSIKKLSSFHAILVHISTVNLKENGAKVEPYSKVQSTSLAGRCTKSVYSTISSLLQNTVVYQLK